MEKLIYRLYGSVTKIGKSGFWILIFVIFTVLTLATRENCVLCSLRNVEIKRDILMQVLTILSQALITLAAIISAIAIYKFEEFKKDAIDKTQTTKKAIIWKNVTSRIVYIFFVGGLNVVILIFMDIICSLKLSLPILSFVSGFSIYAVYLVIKTASEFIPE
mgnify:CR=1 FL=1